MNKFRLETRETESSTGTQYFATMWRMTPKGRFNEAIEFSYRFKTAEARTQYIGTFYSNQETIAARSENAKKAKSEARKNMVNPYKVGDILYDSWGYEQTNIDFYQVVEVGPKSVKIRPIAETMTTKPGYSSMSEFVAPEKDAFTGPEKTKVIQITRDGRPYISSRHGWISKYDGTPKYQSHYA